MADMTLTQALIAAGLLCAAPVAAASDPICADRPGKASATCTAPAGHVQLETGLADWTLERSQRQRDTTLTNGATAIKYGLSERAHIELDVTPFVRASEHEGIGDVVVRWKQRLTADDAPVEVALYPFVKLPTARHAIGNGRVEAGLAAPIGYALPNSRVSLALTPELDWLADGDGHGHHAAMAQVASVGWQADARWNVSAELWGQWDWDPAGTVRQASADGAVAFLVSNDLQLDAGANVGLNRATPDVEIYAGVAKRF
ncbi:MAG: transporter [Sphingomicrobium sp.]